MEKISSFFLKSNSILLITHENPDGDALGSMLGLREILKNLGKSVDCVCCDDVPRPFLFLPGINIIKKDFFLGDYDLIAILDCGDLRRTGFSNRLRELSRYKNKIINIDHHPKNDLHRLAKINLIDFEASSTSEIIYQLIQEMKAEFNYLAATCIF
ncbi:MAG: DHH family phosphoesterase [Patescibacteria group bacterium]|nr:DHH family phosphoesterase [Patescibacteria group bacterium]